MRVVWALIGAALIVLVLIDCFETVLQPRRVTHRFRFARMFFRGTWRVWRFIARRIASGRRRESFLSVFGPFSLLGLISAWVIGLILAFALIHWDVDSMPRAHGQPSTFALYVYLSGTTFFTLGYGDVTPLTTLGRFLAMAEAGLGFSFLAMVIGYLPVLFQAFSLREVTISSLDARAGSPPAAAQVLYRMGRFGSIEPVRELLAGWERWAGELLESHLSFPLLAYYRSQHDNQSWLSALTCMLDTCALLMVEVKNDSTYQAQVTFAMARHAAVDLALVLKIRPVPPDSDRLPEARRQRMRAMLRGAGLSLHDGPDVGAKLAEIRETYEPFVNGLSRRLLFGLPPIESDGNKPDNWQTSAWTRRAPGIGELPMGTPADGHFD